MGQYYQVVIGARQGCNKKVYYPLDFDDGLKLLEHSYVDTDLMKKIHSILYKNPRRVIWVGDYADEKGDEYYSISNKNRELPPRSIPKYSNVWGKKSNRCTDTNIPVIIDYENKYLVNHTNKSYISMKEYYKASKYNQWGIIDPISILTVVGNGRGGGDYSGSNENKVGIWKWHLLSIENNPPDSYTKLNATNYSFVEGP